jgi:hypothetical protein
MKGLYVALRNSGTQLNNTSIMLSVAFYLFITVLNAECRYAECGYAECHGAVIIATWFVLDRPFQPSLIFMGKAAAYLGLMF